MGDKVKILVVDDSITYRQILITVIERIGDAECVGTAASGAIALHKVKALCPDLLFLDVVMPDMDGVETLQRAKQIRPDIEAIMVSSFELHSAKETLRSLQIGALDFVAKPRADSPETSIAELVQYLRPLIHLVQTKKYASVSRQSQHTSFASVGKLPTRTPSPAKPSLSPTVNVIGGVDLILIGVSTGGPKALSQMIPKLPSSLPCPVLIVQHLPPMFTESMAMKLNAESPLRVSEAQGGEIVAPGHVFIAPGGKHLIIERRREGGFCLAVNESPPVNNCRPSVDVLFHSVADVFKGSVLAVIMTGMGRDGTEGVRRLKHRTRTCRCLIQDEMSSVVWGMPGSVFEAGLADEVLPLDLLSARIITYAS